MPPDRYVKAHRPGPTPVSRSTKSSSSGSSSTGLTTLGDIPLYPLLSQVRVHVIPLKLDSCIASLYAQIQALGGKLSGIEECSFAITALKGRPRLERLVGAKWVDSKDFLAPDFISRTFEACRRHGAAFPSSGSHSSILDLGGFNVYITPPKLPPRDRYRIPGTGTSRRLSAEPDVEWPDVQTLADGVRLEDIPSLAIMRRSPLSCVNQDIIDAIKPIMLMREYENPDQKNANVLSYRRSLSMLKAVPRRISSGAEASKLQDVGPKVAERIDEFLATGRVEEAEGIKESEKYQTLNLLASVFTVGTSTAFELYTKYGCRSLEDVAQHYAQREALEWDTGVVGEGIPVGHSFRAESGRRKRRSRDAQRRRMQGKMSQAEIVREWIALREELEEKIPRAEVEEIAACVQDALDTLLPGCRMTITGGYRRGKPESNDVDLVFCPPEAGQDEGLLKLLYTRLADLGIVTHVLQLTAASHHLPVHNNFDGLDKAFVLFRLPPKSGSKAPRLHRRVDFILAPKDKYPLAVLGWSGSMMFERDLRRYAEHERGLKFDSGSLSYRGSGIELHPTSERDIFKVLGLPFVPPECRNADG